MKEKLSNYKAEDVVLLPGEGAGGAVVIRGGGKDCNILRREMGRGILRPERDSLSRAVVRGSDFGNTMFTKRC